MVSMCYGWFSSVQFSRSVMSNSLQPHGLQHTRLPCPSPTPGACSNSCALSQWCHPTISSSVFPFSSCLQSFLASGAFPKSQLEKVAKVLEPASGGQSIWSFSFSISPSREYSGLISFRIDWLVWSSCCGRDSQESSPAPQFRSSNSWALNFLYGPTLTSTHYWKNQSFN